MFGLSFPEIVKWVKTHDDISYLLPQGLGSRVSCYFG